MRVEAQVGGLCALAKKNTQQIAAPRVTRPAETESGLISPDQDGIEEGTNSRCKTAPSKMMRSQ